MSAWLRASINDYILCGFLTHLLTIFYAQFIPETNGRSSSTSSDYCSLLLHPQRQLQAHLELKTAISLEYVDMIRAVAAALGSTTP